MGRSEIASALLASQWLIGAIFVVAGSLKLTGRSQFVSEVADYRVLPRALVGPLAVSLPPVEIAAGGSMFLPSARMFGAIVLMLCLVTFSVAVGINLLRGRTDLSCACFGKQSRRIDWFIPARNGLMLVTLLAASIVSTRASAPSLAASITVFIGLDVLWIAWEARALNTPIGGENPV